MPTILLDNDSALNVFPLATTVALSFSPSNFWSCAHGFKCYEQLRVLDDMNDSGS